MKVNGVHNGQNFGMAFKLKGDGAINLAARFHSYSDPKIAEKAFVDKFISPLQKLKSDVVYDGSHVVVHDAMSAKAFEVLDKDPNIGKYLDKTTISYDVKSIGVNVDSNSYMKLYGDTKDVPDISSLKNDELERKLLIAKEIAEDLDSKIPTIETQKDTASRLKNVFA